MADQKPPEFTDEELELANKALERSGALPPLDSIPQPVEEDLNFTDDELLAAEEEMKKYGSDPEQIAIAATEAAARGASLGLSDLAAAKAGAPMHEMYAREVENPILTTTVDLGTTVAAALLSGGTETAAMAGGKIAAREVEKSLLKKALTAPIRAVSATAKATAGVADKALTKAGITKIAAESGRKQFVKNLVNKAIVKGTELGTEGALYSAGRALSDDALGKEDLTAESFVANVGAGALLGGAFGGAIGTGSVILPALKDLSAPLTARLAKSFENLTSPEAAAVEITGLPASQVVKMERQIPNFKSRLVGYLQKIVRNASDDSETIAANSQKYLDDVGNELGTLTKQLDEAAIRYPGAVPTRRDFYAPIKQELRELLSSAGSAKDLAASELVPVRNAIKWADKQMNSLRPFKFAEMEANRKFIGKLVEKFKRQMNPTFAGEAADIVYGAHRQAIDNIALRIERSTASPSLKGLANRLSELNGDYHIGRNVQKALELKAERGSAPSVKELLHLLTAFNLAGTTGAILGIGKVAFRRNTLQNMALKGDLVKANANIAKAIKNAIPAFVGASKAVATGAKFSSLNALQNSGFAVSKNEKGKIELPKNRKEAFQNIKTNLTKYAADTNLMQERLIKATAKVSAHAPGVGQYMSTTLVRAATFLQSKLPKDPSGAFAYPWERPHEPSNLEVAKFERYVQAVESPMSVLDEAQKGTLTREHVEALKTVYPVLYNHIRSQVFDQLSEKGPNLKVSYNKKVMLANLLELPLDQSLTPGFINDMQDTFKVQSQLQQQQAAIAPTMSGVSKIQKSERVATDTQKVLERRNR